MHAYRKFWEYRGTTVTAVAHNYIKSGTSVKFPYNPKVLHMADPETAEDQRKDIPTSLTIVNEATPLLSNSTSTVTGASSGSNRRSSTISLSTDHSRRKKEILGLLLMTLSALGFSVMSLCVKLGGVVFPSFEMVFARSLVQLVLGLAGCAILKVNPLGDKKVRGWLVLRGLAGSIGLSLFFYSLTVLPLADATVIFFLGPIFTALLATVALHEPFSLFDGICATFCLVGVVLVSRPEFLFGKAVLHVQEMDAESERIFAIICAVIGAMMSAVAYVTVRKIGKGAHFMVHVVYFGALSSALSPIGIWGFQHFVMPETFNDYLILVLVGTFAFLGQCLLNQGLQMAPAGPGTLMRMNDIVFAFLFGILLLHEIPTLSSILGAAVIVGCTTALGIHKWYINSIRVVTASREANN
ncbi:hypothetical protein INT43_003193 [Umbelopsis isabellina]|uniref:EamA domain-containing protein n=1 Tax=Mortierella isabellina TaxID=91625 RepID=A0A8H7PRJ9_MORIS|nr:hypothetical protein INT43_003193 [Umbelopsis isabellina]